MVKYIIILLLMVCWVAFSEYKSLCRREENRQLERQVKYWRDLSLHYATRDAKRDFYIAEIDEEFRNGQV